MRSVVEDLKNDCEYTQFMDEVYKAVEANLLSHEIIAETPPVKIWARGRLYIEADRYQENTENKVYELCEHLNAKYKRLFIDVHFNVMKNSYVVVYKYDAHAYR